MKKSIEVTKHVAKAFADFVDNNKNEDIITRELRLVTDGSFYIDELLNQLGSDDIDDLLAGNIELIVVDREAQMIEEIKSKLSAEELQFILNNRSLFK